jgi:hypothetical protein
VRGTIIIGSTVLHFPKSILTLFGQKASKYSLENAPRDHFCDHGKNGKKTKIQKSKKRKRDPEKLFIRDPRNCITTQVV